MINLSCNHFLRKARYLSVAFFTVFCLVNTSIAAEADDYFDLAPEELLRAEVISVSRRAEPISHAPAAVFVVSSEDIARSGAMTIPDALRMVPGVQVAQSDSNTWAVSIRGFNATLANKILVMIDGRTVYNPLHAGTYWEAHNLMLEDIDRIEVVRGPGGALWGANAVNGVINIITKSAKETQGNLISQGYGNYHRGFVNARHGGMIGEDAYYRVYAKYFNRDSFRDSPSGDMDSPDEWDGYRSGFRVDWDRSIGDKLTLQGDIYRTNSEQFAQNYSLTAPFSIVTEETAKNAGGNLTAHWTHDFGDGSSFFLRSYVDYSTRDETILKDDRVILDLESQYNFSPLGRHELIAGAGYRYMIDNLSGSPLTEFHPASRKDPLYTAFINDKITLVPDHWYLTLGTKFEHNHYTGFEVQPNARLAWMPNESQTFWAAASRAVRTPSRIERDLVITNFVAAPGALPAPFNLLPAELSLVNNRDFDSEKLVAYEVGYRNQITRDLSIDAAAFINNYHDLQTLDSLGAVIAAGPPAHVDLPLLAVNDGSAETFGVELDADWLVADNWKLSAAYTYLEMFLHAPTLVGTSQEDDEGQSPVHQASIRSSWNINESWTLDSALYYVDELPTFDTPDYVRLDMNLGWEMAEGLQFNLVGKNLFGGGRAEFNPNSVNASEVGTSVFGKLTWEF